MKRSSDDVEPPAKKTKAAPPSLMVDRSASSVAAGGAGQGSAAPSPVAAAAVDAAEFKEELRHRRLQKEIEQIGAPPAPKDAGTPLSAKEKLKRKLRKKRNDASVTPGTASEPATPAITGGTPSASRESKLIQQIGRLTQQVAEAELANELAVAKAPTRFG